MAKYESQIKQVPYSQKAVYSKVADLTHLAAIKERINDPKVQEQIPADKLEEVRKSLEQMECTADTLSTPVGPIGNISVTLRSALSSLQPMHLSASNYGYRYCQQATRRAKSR